MESIPVTERRNERTLAIDVASPLEIVKMLHMCEREIFNGYGGSKGILENSVLKTMNELAEQVSTLLQDSSNNIVVMSGSGTSGRLAFMAARTFNDQLISRHMAPCYDYLMSGGDRASFQSREAPEDDPATGRNALIQSCTGKKRALLIGITCGLSAAYVAGQLDACMEAELVQCVPALIGFNPIELARKTPIENWGDTFYSARTDKWLHSHEEWYDHEDYTGNYSHGSTPEGIPPRIAMAVFNNIQLTYSSALMLIKTYQLIMEDFYEASRQQKLSQIITLAGESLKENGHVYYVASDSLGIVAMVDASECPPTFGADLNDIRGFFTGGYSTLANKEGDLSEFFEVSTEYFEESIVSGLSNKDMIILLCKDGTCEPIITPTIIESGAKKVVVRFGRSSQQRADDSFASFALDLHLPWDTICETVTTEVAERCEQLYHELVCKLACNAISTGAHIQRGKVFENVMVDVKVSNTKLFHRAVAIIELFANCTKGRAQEALLKVIYESDELTEEQKYAALSSHIRRASAMKKVVPMALIVTLTNCSVDHAQSILRTTSRIRTAIEQCLKGA